MSGTRVLQLATLFTLIRMAYPVLPSTPLPSPT